MGVALPGSEDGSGRLREADALLIEGQSDLDRLNVTWHPMPAAVRQSATPGAHTVSISFRVLRSGEIAYARIVRRSGEETVDAAARASLARAFPLPPFPTSMKGPARDFVLPYRFMVPERVEETNPETVPDRQSKVPPI